MKKKIFSLMIGAVVALASCSKSDDVPTLPQSGEQLATFNIEAPATRAAVTGLSRYIVEAYEGKDLTTTPIRVEAATGSLTVALKKDTEYTFVFWADKGVAKTEAVASSGYWNTASLKAVAVSVGKEATVGEAAYCLAVSFNSKDFETKKAVILKNATSQINFVEAAGLTAAGNSLVVKYSSSNTLNVATGEVTEVAGEVTHTFSNIAKAAKDATIASDYLLAPLDEKLLLDVKVTFNAEEEKTIAAVPFQQNFATNIKGEYSNLFAGTFTITADDVWGTPENDVNFGEPVKFGDFYYSDNTFSTTLDAAKTCIGIVYIVNADGTTGKIVGLTEGRNKKWGPSGNEMADGINSATDGATATKNLITARKDNVDFATNYPAFEWVYTTVNGGNINGRWYLPARDELTALYAAWNGDATTTVNAIARAAFNARLVAVNASLSLLSDVPALLGNYWSSMQDEDNYAWDVYFGNGKPSCCNKDNDISSVLVVSAF